MYYRYLRGRLKQLGIEMDELSIRMKMSRPSLSRRFNCRIPWSIEEAYQLMNIIGAVPEELHLYFPRDGKTPA